MSNDPFKRSSLAVWIVIVILMSLPVTLILVTGESVISSNNWNASKFPILFYGGIFLVFAYLCSLPIIQLMTNYRDDGIEQPSIFGSKFLYWRDIKEIRNITTGNIVLVGPNTKININPNLFVNFQSLMIEIRSRVPGTAFPSDTQINQEIISRKRNDAMRSAIGAFIFAVFVFIVGTNLTATIIIGLLVIVYALYETRRWIKYRRKQS